MSKVPEPGTTLGGKYLVDRVLGVGGMGVVVAATHVQLDQRVALKFLLPEALANPEVVARFSREARAAAKIRGEHVARVIDVGAFDDGTPFMVMEYLEGHDLSKELERRGPLPIADLARYVLETCEALAEAHAAKIVHRDLKPSNLFLAEQPDKRAIIKVLDFGISKLEDKPTAGLTKTSALMGTAFYMSPEQLTTPKDVDHRSDIWALGVILYELSTGKQPFLGETVPEIIASILQSQREPLASLRADAPAGLVAVVDRCLAFKAADRYANVAELAAAIAPLAAPEDRRSVAAIGRVLGERVSLDASPPSAVVRPPASTSLPSPVGKTQPVGAVTSQGLSTSVTTPAAQARKPRARIAGVVAVSVAAAVGIGISMKPKTEPAPASGLVGAPPASAPVTPPVTTIVPEPLPVASSATPVATEAPPASASVTTAKAAVPAVAPRPTATAGGAVKTALGAAPTSAPTPSAPATASSATKNPLQMGIK